MLKKFFSPMVILLLVVFIDVIGIGILIPVIPQLIANPTSPEYLLPASMSLKDGYILLGLLTATFPLGQFIATPILGQLSDKYGRKKLLAICLTGTSLSYVAFAFGIATENLYILFISRFIDGITGGNIAVAQAAIADITKPENRAKNFGLMGAMFGLGFILGPSLGGRLSDPDVFSSFNAATPFWFAAILAMINVILIIFVLPETNMNMAKEAKIKMTKALSNIAHAFTNRRLLPVFTTSFLLMSGFTFFTTFASVFFIKKFGWDQGDLGDFFTYIGVCSVLVQAILVGNIVKRYNEVQILKVSLIGAGIMVGMFFLPNEVWQVLLATAIFASFNGLTQAALPSLMSRSAQEDDQGEVLGIGASVQALGQSIPPVLSGFIAASLSPESTILIASAIIIAAGLFFNIMYRNYKAAKVVDLDNSGPMMGH